MTQAISIESPLPLWEREGVRGLAPAGADEFVEAGTAAAGAPPAVPLYRHDYRPFISVAGFSAGTTRCDASRPRSRLWRLPPGAPQTRCTGRKPPRDLLRPTANCASRSAEPEPRLSPFRRKRRA